MGPVELSRGATAPVYVTERALDRYRQRVGPVEREELAELCRDAPLATHEQFRRMCTAAAHIADPTKHYRVAHGVVYCVQRGNGCYRLLTVFRLRA